MKLRCHVCDKKLDNRAHYLYGNHRICSHRCYNAIEHMASNQQIILDIDDPNDQSIDLIKRRKERATHDADDDCA
jgi:hypothetical protein